MIKEEEWVDIKDFEGMYKVSSYGRVMSMERQVKTAHGTRTVRQRVLKGRGDKDGYLGVVLSKGSVTKTFKIHRLVANYFVENNDNLPQVNHIDGNKTNNYCNNLEWVCNLKNTNHYHNNNGTKKYGVHMCNNKWRARIKKDGKSINIGFFENKEDAYQAFFDKYTELHGVTPW